MAAVRIRVPRRTWWLNTEFRRQKEQKMANKTLTLKLTLDQQKQIKEATGKDIKEISLAVASTGQLTEKDLELVNAGGLRIIHVA
jgi:hypothetical protein